MFGISHQNTPYHLLEKFAFNSADQKKILIDVQSSPQIDEVFLISTCNRLEVYSVVQAFHPGLMAIAEVLSQYSGVSMQDISKFAQVKYSQAAVKHAFALTSGLDSAVVGEQQILAQWKDGYAQGQELNTAGPTLHRLAQSALRTAKKVRNTTGIDKSGASLISIAVDHAISISERPVKNVTIIGAGSMGSLAASYLSDHECTRVDIVNRTLSKAQRIADTISSRTAAYAWELSDAAHVIAHADLIISCTGSQEVVVSDQALREIFPAHTASYPVCVDLSLPASIVVNELPVHVISLSDITQLSSSHRPQQEIEHAWKLVDDLLEEFFAQEKVADIVPTVAALREHAVRVMESEISRFDRKNKEVPEHMRDEMVNTIHRVVDKLLHLPTVRIKELSTQDNGENYTRALQELFALTPGITSAISSPDAPISPIVP